ncbi:MAG: class C sortase [Clostridia bacterium]|nr:class C sortase [Clostridia bacterium]
MKKNIPTVLFAIALFVGIGFLIYPSVSNYWNCFHQSMAVAEYIENVSNLSEKRIEKVFEKAEKYNEAIDKNGINLLLSGEEKDSYNHILSISDSGIIGYIDINRINCHLPIYHGTSESVLQVAIGHLPGSSLPIGGKSTHCVLLGHRGLPSAKIFSDLNQMTCGDIFVINTLNRTLTYEVDQILTVAPTDTSALKIQPGEDLCTLVTCTPYSINSHRLLIRGKRVENKFVSTANINSEALVLSVMQSALLFLPLVAAMGFFGMMLSKNMKVKRNAVRKKIRLIT